MIEINTEGFKVFQSGGMNSKIIVQIDCIDQSEGLNILDALVKDSSISLKDILDYVDIEEGSSLLNYVAKNFEASDILEKLEEQDIVDFITTDADEPSRLISILNAMLDVTDAESIEKELSILKTKRENR